jgi:hypothetical protein
MNHNKPPSSPPVQEIRSADLKLRAYRIGGGGAIEFTLPCGQKRRMTRTEADALAARIKTASERLTTTTDSREF